MSFSGTPLGHGRRLDRNAFHKKPPARPPSPNRLVPTSYPYGPPTLAPRSPPKPPSPHRDRLTDDTDSALAADSALARFARIKQHEQASLAARPGGPRTITTPPNPETWNVKDTTVNIASAFFQAASAPDMNTTTNPHNWAPAASVQQRASVPRSTSVEYELESQAATARRLAPPPNRLSRTTAPRKPVSKAASLRQVPDSEAEQEDDQPAENGRGKSPFQQMVSSAKRVLGPASFYLQQRRDLGESSTDTLAPQDPSYDYAQEEEAYKTKSARRNPTATHKRNRMSEDNKAYKPALSDEQSSDEDEDERKGRKKKKKSRKDPTTGGPLSTLPVISADKKRPKRPRVSKGTPGGHEEEYESESDDQTADRQSNQPASVRDSLPPLMRQSSLPRQPSLPRGSLPPEPDNSMDTEQALDSIPEVDEEQLYDNHHQRRSLSRPPASHIGGPLGHVVNFAARTVKSSAVFVIQILTALLYFFGKIVGTIFDILLRRPILWLSRANLGSDAINAVMKSVVIALILSAAYMYREPFMRHLPGRPTAPIYHAPDTPAADIAELSARLQRLEAALGGISIDAEKGRINAENHAKSHLDLVGRLGSLENKVSAEVQRAADAGMQERNAAKEGLKSVEREIATLQTQVQQQQHSTKPDINGTDDEARARVKALEERLGNVEGGVKEALELGKKSGSATNWWSKPMTGSAGKAGLTIKSTDGQDVTSVIAHLVDSAVSTYSKDTLARPDFALHSGGARIIPSLTSPTFEMRPTNLKSQIVGLLTGNGYAIGRPPITALHHELHNGHCWPFAGSQGQLGVALAAPTYISDITIDHVAPEVAFDMRSAPRDMEVWGMVEGKDNVSKVDEWLAERARTRQEARERGEEVEEEPVYPDTVPPSPRYIRLANFSYDVHAPKNVQTFPVSQDIRDLGVDFGIVVLLIKNNWGREEYTCLYRLRVHGQRMGETSPTPHLQESV